MSELNSGDHDIYCCGQETLRRNAVALLVNKRFWNAVLGYSLKNDNNLSSFPKQTIEYNNYPSLCPNSNAKEAEVQWFYEDLQDLLELTPKTMSFSL